MSDFKNELKNFAFNKGADLVGVASKERFEGAPKEHKPEDILSKAKSVVVCAKKIPEGILNGIPTSYQKTMDTVHFQLDLLAYEIAVFLEQKGGIAIPVPSDDPYWDWDPENIRGRGDLSHRHAAQAAGLGRLGKNSLLISPKFGNRVHLVSIVTNFDLMPDPLIEEDLCPESCFLCIKACLAKAIEEGPRINQKKCRAVMFQKIVSGTTEAMIEKCWECRKVCRVGIK
ncbi:MAG: epoxyqueuosine reductase [Candidatus Aminicenantia bacterium]